MTGRIFEEGKDHGLVELIGVDDAAPPPDLIIYLGEFYIRSEETPGLAYEKTVNVAAARAAQ